VEKDYSTKDITLSLRILNLFDKKSFAKKSGAIIEEKG
jgi:hypothetical protein